jgi:hypothetical protein
MEKFFKDIQRNFKSHHLIGLLALVFVVVALSQYSDKKGLDFDTFGSPKPGATNGPAPAPEYAPNGSDAETLPQPTQAYEQDAAGGGDAYQAAGPKGTNEVYSAVSGIDTSLSGLPNGCASQPVTDPSDLLPKDNNNEWAKLNPSGAGDFTNVNLLKAGFHMGIDTIGNTLRNANLQVRSEPANPQTQVSPWLNTTISPDLMRVPLELGCGPQ